ncbi:putative malonic semialdehyde reductase RutE, partial [Frankliniella fusca]
SSYSILKRVATGRGHILDVAIDGGRWLEEKRKKVLEAAGAQDETRRPHLPITGWENFPGHEIPIMFNEGDVYHWIVESVPQVLPDLLNIEVEEEAPPDDDEEEHIPPGRKDAFRRGRKFIKSNFILNVKDRDTSDL